MPSFAGSFVGALILTYFISRAALYALRGSRGVPRLLIAHGATLALLVLAVGFGKAYFTSFAYHQTYVFFLPQLIWFAFDLARGKGDR